MNFSTWLLNEISTTLAGKLRQLLSTEGECGGYTIGEEAYLLNRGQKGNVIIGNADSLRSLNCDYTFHTHPREQDVPYPSPMDIVAVYMINKPNLVVCRTAIWAVTPQKAMQWQDVEKISKELWIEAERESHNPYVIWKQKVQKYFPVKIEKAWNV